MNSQLETKLRQLSTSLRAEKHLVQLKERLESQKIELSRLNARIHSTIRTMDKSQKPSFTRLVKTILGTDEELLELHKRHYLNLVLQQNELEKSVLDTETEIDLLQPTIKDADRLRREIKSLVRKTADHPASPEVNKLREIMKESERLISLQCEIEEAITIGAALNRKFNTAIKFLERFAKELHGAHRNKDELIGFEVLHLDQYQQHIVVLKHYLIKFESELNDVYDKLLSNSQVQLRSLHKSFIEEYRLTLLAEIEDHTGLVGSHLFLKRPKEHSDVTDQSLKKRS